METTEQSSAMRRLEMEISEKVKQLSASDLISILSGRGEESADPAARRNNNNQHNNNRRRMQADESAPDIS